jgi:hypothetical protein
MASQVFYRCFFLSKNRLKNKFLDQKNINPNFSGITVVGI